ncbi:hypothetical protein [Actinacidiphila alni]
MIEGVAATMRHAFTELRLHRLEASIQPARPSRRSRDPEDPQDTA